MSLAEMFQKYPNRKYVMYGGKGGLGKTTFSAATAYWLAKQGKKVLVFSVDPQASLSDIFERDIFGKGAVEIIPNLYAQEIDADQRIREYQKEIRQKIIDMYGMDKIPDEIEHYIEAASAEPAMEESAIFDAVVDIVVQGGFDYYIYDLVPLGHALYYLSMGAIYDAWLEKITGLREQMREYDSVIATTGYPSGWSALVSSGRTRRRASISSAGSSIRCRRSITARAGAGLGVGTHEEASFAATSSGI